MIFVKMLAEYYDVFNEYFWFKKFNFDLTFNRDCFQFLRKNVLGVDLDKISSTISIIWVQIKKVSTDSTPMFNILNQKCVYNKHLVEY